MIGTSIGHGQFQVTICHINRQMVISCSLVLSLTCQNGSHVGFEDKSRAIDLEEKREKQS